MPPAIPVRLDSAPLKHAVEVSHPATSARASIVPEEGTHEQATYFVSSHNVRSTPPTTTDTGIRREEVGGIIVGVVSLVVLIAVLWFCCGSRRRTGTSSTSSSLRSASPPPPKAPPPIPLRRPSGKPVPLPGPPVPPVPPPPIALPKAWKPTKGTSAPVAMPSAIPIKPMPPHLPESVTNPRPQTYLIPTVMDTAYDNAEKLAVKKKKGYKFVIGNSKEGPKAVGYTRKKKNKNLPSEGINPYPSGDPE